MTQVPLLGFVVLVVLAFGALGERAARASPFARSAEDATADGDLDAEDLVGRATAGRHVVPSPRGGETWVSLGAFTRRSIYGDREVGGLVVVGLPLDRLARAATRPSGHTPDAAMALTNAGLTTSTTSGDAPASVVTPRVARTAVEAAWRAASLGTDDARLDAIVSRAHWSAALPETRLRAIRYDDQRLSTNATIDTSRLSDSTGANVGLEARLTWRFDRLLYADDEPSFERIRLEHHDARMRIAARVLDALFQWNRAWVEVRWAQAASRDAREPLNRPSRDEVEASMRVMEAEATLDVLTGGWFTSTRSRAVGPPAAPAVPSPRPRPPQSL